MTWVENHRESERLAAEAEVAAREGNRDRAQQLYARAADAEDAALDALDLTKKRTLGVSAVSAVALRYKAAQYQEVEAACYKWLRLRDLPYFAAAELKTVLQAVWSEQERKKSGIQFAPGEVLVSVKGGEVLSGGAPLDLVVEKIQTVQAMFYRTAELIKGLPHRKRGGPTSEIQEMCRPWLFQTAPGSYQFAVAIQEPRQHEMFKSSEVNALEVSRRFLEILRATVEDSGAGLADLVPDNEYRGTFLKLTRNLAPSGRSFDLMEIRPAEDARTVSLIPALRKALGQTLRRDRSSVQPPSEQEEVINGTLRAVHLDQDWIEVSVGSEQVKISDVGEAIDDTIGPMVNRRVIVHVVQDRRGRKVFRDIEPED